MKLTNLILLMSFVALLFPLSAPTVSAQLTNITNCSDIATSGSYIMNVSIPNSANTTCINVSVPDVIFDCDNYSIDGTDLANSYGIYVYNATGGGMGIDNITIKNCNISDFYVGVFIKKVNDSIVDNCNITSNTRGIEIETVSNRINITNSSIYDNTAKGLRFTTPSIRNCTIYNNNFTNNSDHVEAYNTNFWNITKYTGTNIIGGSSIGGNYYDDYTGNDTDGDDIGDTNLDHGGTDNVDYLPLILKDYGNLTITTPDGDQNWTYSQSVGTDELFNLTVSTSGNVNSTLNFSLTGIDPTNFTLNITNTSIAPGSTSTIQVNITSNSSLSAGTYNFNITCNQSDDSDITNISITATVSAIAGDVDITETSWSIAKAESDIVKRTFTIQNKGDYNLTGCNMSFTNTLGSTATFNYSNFIQTNTTNHSVLMTVSGGSAGTDNSARVNIICVATSTGGTDSDQVTGSISISAPSGGGSGGFEPPLVGGDFDVYPSQRIVGVGYPETLIQPPFVVNLYNGNVSQKFYMTFSSELNEYCELLEYPEGTISPNGYTKFVFECQAPDGTKEGHVYIKSVGGSERAIPMTLIGGTGLWAQFNAFFIMLLNNPFQAVMMNLIFFGWQIPIWSILVVMIIAVVIFLKREAI